MKKVLIIFFVLNCIFVFAKNDIKIPSLTGRVVDNANVLSGKDKDELEQSVKKFENDTKGQIAICTIKSLNKIPIEQVSMAIAENWKIGFKGKDNGILILLCPKDRQFRIEVGYGFEGKLNDAKAGDIGRLASLKFKDKNWKDGLNQIVNNCNKVITGKTNIEQINKQYNHEKQVQMYIILAIILIVVFLIIVTKGEILIIFIGGSSSSSGSGFGGGGGSFGGGGFSGKF